MSESKSVVPLPPRKAPKKKIRTVARQPGRMLRQAASLAGRGIERVNQELYKRNAELAIRNKTLALLRTLDEISLVTVEIDEMAKKIAEAIAKDLGYEMVSIAITNPKDARWLLPVWRSFAVNPHKYLPCTEPRK